MQRHSAIAALMLGFFLAIPSARAAETIWIEAEHLHGVRGSCFPDMGHKTNGHWAISGPGIAPAWTQGGESEWMSIACGPDDDKASATYDFEVPEAGQWKLWVRYRDWRQQSELFAVRIEQDRQPVVNLVFGAQPVVDEDDEFKLLWKWAFGWDSRTVKLAKGSAKLTLLAHAKQAGHRQVDCFCLTTDSTYRPYHREKPANATWKLLEELRVHPEVAPHPLAPRTEAVTLPDAWKLATFRNKGFVYLWNVGAPWLEDLASQKPNRMLVPYNTDPALLVPFRAAYGGHEDVPIFSDPRLVPAFHGAGPNILDNPHVVRWLESHPDRAWANMMNYIDPKPMTADAKANWSKFRDRYVGNISGENLGYFHHDADALKMRLKAARNREQVLDALTDIYKAANAAKQKTIFGTDVANPYQYTIPCQSSDMTVFAHAARAWGARTIGYENQGVAPSLAMRLAFLRGGARQYSGLFATYRSCNFGDSATIYSRQSTYAEPKYVYDNWYDVWAGNGMTWYKFDIWQQYLSGSALFYHEQGFDEFWTPGGGSTAVKPIQLSPKGRLVQQFLQLTKKHPDRGTPFTPIAFLLDRAHGWEPTSYQPGYFGLEPSLNPTVLALDLHARMLKEWFKVAYHPYGPKEASLNTGVNQNWLPSRFGDIFDVLVTDPSRMAIVDSYPVVVLGGDLTLSAAWGKRLADYMRRGGTLIVSDEQLTGPGVAELKLPDLGAAAEDRSIQWKPTDKKVASQRFRYRPIKDGQTLAAAANGDAIAAVFPRGQGRLVFLSVPRGLGIDRAATPLTALVLANARQGLLPLEVEGEVEWMLNRTASGWLVALLNPAGSNKPQHGMVVTDYAQTRAATIRSRMPWTQAHEWIGDTKPTIERQEGRTAVRVVVPAGGVRIVELR